MVLRFLSGFRDLPYRAGLLVAVTGETRIDNAANRPVPVTLPISNCPELILFEPILHRSGPASSHELLDESPVRQPYPVAVENIAHGRALEPMVAQPFQDGITGLAGTLTQLVQVIHETLGN